MFILPTTAIFVVPTRPATVKLIQSWQAATHTKIKFSSGAVNDFDGYYFLVWLIQPLV